MNMNRVILAGNLTRDPQLSYTPAQKPVVDFGMAINRNWTGKDGEKREEICFVDCRAFGKTGETINGYLHKGSPILLEGRLSFSRWEKDGRKYNKLRVTVDNFQFIQDGEKREQAPQPAQQQAPAPAPQQAAPQQPPAQQPASDLPPYDAGNPDDIPF